MPALVIAARLLLSAVFLSAGISKLFDRAGSRKSLQDFGVPDWLCGPLAVALPVVEIAIGVGLIPARLAWYASGGALALMAAFICGIAVTLVRGRKPDCHCFGKLHSKPIGWDLVARNAALASIAALVLYSGPAQPGIAAQMSSASAGYPLLLILGLGALVVLAGNCWLTFQVVRQGGRILLRLEEIEKRLASPTPGQAAPPQPSPVRAAPPAPGLPVGEQAPAFSLADLDGRKVSLDELLTGVKSAILVFVNPDCGPCAALLPKVERWQAQKGEQTRIVVISQGTRKQNLAKVKSLVFERFLLQEKQEVWDAYKCSATPSAVMVREDGTVGSGVAAGAEQIQALVANAINEAIPSAMPASMRENDPVPRLLYPDLDGRLVALPGTPGRPQLLLFWSPTCGFCRQMSADVNKWHDSWPPPLPAVVVIASGSLEDNRQMGLKPPVLLDRHFSAGRAFGARSTPSAIWFDERGRVASKLAVGRDEIAALISSHATAQASHLQGTSPK